MIRKIYDVRCENDYILMCSMENGNLSWPNGHEVSANTVSESGMLTKKLA